MTSLASCSLEKRIAKADKQAAIGEYYDAADAYKRILPKIKKDKKALKGEIAFKQAECYRHINHPKAAQTYAVAIRNKYQNIDPIVYLRNAQTLQYQGKYKEAAKQYNLYLEAVPDSYEAQAGAYACAHIDEWKREYSRYKIAVPKEFLNKRSSTFSPAFVGEDGSALMFTSNRTNTKKKDQKLSRVTGATLNQLFTTRKDAQGKWVEIEPTEGLSPDDLAAAASEGAGEGGGEEGENSGAEKKATAELGVCCFSADGRTMYFTFSKPVNGKDLGAKIYTSERASGSWSEPQEVKLFSDSSITVGHPALCHTGDTLFFASDAPGGFGGKDIWYSILEGSNWSFPENMGPEINSTGDELFPTIRPDGTLFFASNGHPGYGGLDLFKASLDSLATAEDSTGQKHYLIWNMGQPFNSNGDDFGITFEGNTENGFFSSNRGDKKGLDKIYSFTLPEMIFALEGTVQNTQGEALGDVTIRVIGDDGTNVKMQARRDGTYRLKIKQDVNYVLLATARGYLNQKQQISTFNQRDSYTFTQDFTLTSLSKPVKMDNVFYEFGKWTLTPESTNSLDGLVRLLNDNPNITIELSAHTDMVGNEKANKTLSEKRAESVVQYLISKGIAADRLTPVGYGKEKPVVADKNLNKQYPFLPIDQALTEDFILSLPKDQQDICNQINRRTEFKVLKTTYGLY